MTTGAMIIWGNLIDDNPSSFATSGIIDPANLLLPQLSPKAEIIAQIATTDHAVIEWSTLTMVNPVFNVVQLLGVSDGSIRPARIAQVLLERRNGPGWLGVSHRMLRVTGTTFTDEHVLLITDELQTLKQDYRVRIVPGAGGIQIGHIRVSRMIQRDELADAGFSIDYPDTGTTDSSGAGQLYTQSGSVRRRLSISQAVVEHAVFNGALINPVDVPIPAPTASGPVSQSGDVWVTDGTLGIATLNYGSLFIFGSPPPGYKEAYSLTYDLRIDGPAAKAFAKTDQIPTLPIGNVTIFQSPLVPTAIKVSFGANVTGQIVSFELQRVERGLVPLAANFPTTMQPAGAGVADVIAQVGTTQPVTVVVRPGDPFQASVTAFYGLIQSWQPYTDIPGSGQHTAGGFTLLESL